MSATTPTPLTIPSRFTALDGWRGICAMLVALYHFHTTSHVEQWAVVRHGYLFVDFFFVLSGFVITYAYADRLATLQDAVLMIWRRLGRLWPLHVVLLIVLILLELGIPAIAHLLGVSRSAAGSFDPASPALISAIPTNFLLLHGLGMHDRLTWNFPSWSISAELWTYVVFASVVVLARGRILLAAVLALIVLSGAIVVLGSNRGIAVDYDLGLFRSIAGFFVGHITFRLVKAFPLALRGSATLYEAAGILGVLAFVCWAGRTPFEFAAPLVFGAVVWLFALERGKVSAVLCTAPLRTLGLVSYSIYMVHSLIIIVAHRAATVIGQLTGTQLTVELSVAGGTARHIDFGGPWAMDAVVLLYMFTVIGVARLTWRWIEMPAQSWWNSKADAIVGQRRSIVATCPPAEARATAQ